MKSIEYYIPKLERVIQRPAERTKPNKESIAEIEQYLLSCGYHAGNEQLFDCLAYIGAQAMEGRLNKGVWIRGNVGIGKTFGLKLLAARFRWGFYNIKDLESLFLDEKTSSAKFERIIRAEKYNGEPTTLIIDDVGIESCPILRYGTPYNLAADILDIRYRLFTNERINTFITSNLSDEDIRDRYGIRIDDRLNEMLAIVTLRGRSLRK